MAQPAIVLLHAFPLDPRMFGDQVDALAADGWQVLTPDLDFTRHPTMDAMADAVVAEADAQGVDQFVLGGLSMGGYVSFAVLRRHPERVRAVVLADTRAGADTDEVRARRISQQAQVRAAGSAAPVLEAMLAALPGPSTKEHRPDVMARIRALMEVANPGPERAVAALEAMKNRPDSTGELAAIAVPALVVAGDEDAVSPPAVAEDMAARLPQGRVWVFPQVGHLANLEAPEAFNGVLREFLAGLSAP